MAVSEMTIETPDGLSLDACTHAAAGQSRGAVLLAHGITQDMDEGGMFARLADCLTDAGFDVVRFSYRGHGDSDGRPAGVTIAGECLDFETAFEYTVATFDGPYFVLAKSFGAVSACCSLERFDDDIAGLVLWNPALDLDSVFLDPTAPWGIEQFTGANRRELRETGRLTLDSGFELGRVLFEELHRYDPAERFRERSVPALVIHGDADGIVPYTPVREIATESGATFHTVEDGNHGFVTPTRDPDADAYEQDRRTVEWLRSQVEG